MVRLAAMDCNSVGSGGIVYVHEYTNSPWIHHNIHHMQYVHSISIPIIFSGSSNLFVLLVNYVFAPASYIHIYLIYTDTRP